MPKSLADNERICNIIRDLRRIAVCVSREMQRYPHGLYRS
jgi:hypothetical protein